jgi:glycosyltransferase involved in cell wall biosynthesis
MEMLGDMATSCNSSGMLVRHAFGGRVLARQRSGTEPVIMNRCKVTGNKPSVCFVSLPNFATLVDNPELGRIGGAEMQQAIIGRSLAERGYRVSFVTLDHGQDDELEIDGMRIVKAYDQNVGMRALRFVHPRFTGLWRAMKRADADIYYQRTGSDETGMVAAFCRLYRRTFVFAVASDAHCAARRTSWRKKPEHVLYEYGLRRANVVIAQTTTQQKLLRKNYGIDSTVIRNCAPDYGSCQDGTDTAASIGRTRFLWVGSLSPVKRLELLLDVAESHPDLQFDVVGDGDSTSEYVQRILSRARSLPNVELHGKVPHAQIHHLYQRSVALVCTSRIEGFPNVFLEAWSAGLPVVSTFDPDNVIVAEELGAVAQGTHRLASELQSLRGSPDRWRETSRKVRQYFLENHSVETVIPRLEHVLLAAVDVATP